jgi:raffinose/stachyose/melibiose transport system permease protein
VTTVEPSPQASPVLESALAPSPERESRTRRRPRPTRAGSAGPRRRLTTGRVFVYAVTAAIALTYVVPLAFLFNTALKKSDNFLADPSGLTKDVALGNFAQAWERGNFGAYFLNSLLYTAAAATLSTVVTLLLAFPVARGYIPGSRRFWPAVFVVALFLPNALTAQFQLILRLGLYDNRLGYILLMGSSLGVGPLLVMGYLRSLPRELDEAAALDGCGYFRYLFSFVVPLTRPVLVTVFILHCIGVWNDIITATIYLADPAKYPVTVGLFAFKGQYSNDWALLAAATLLVAVPLVILFVFMQRFIVAGVTQGALKS